MTLYILSSSLPLDNDITVEEALSNFLHLYKYIKYMYLEQRVFFHTETHTTFAGEVNFSQFHQGAPAQSMQNQFHKSASPNTRN